jgi:GNAT superfamily N-acetyltransferase
MDDDIIVRPLTPARWSDLLELFGDNGAYGGCWCMYFRRRGKEYDNGCRNRGRGNKAAFKELVDKRRVPGLLAFRDGHPVGWCSVAPREQFGRVENSPQLKPIDDADDVWAIVCFYIHRKHRGDGVATALLGAAVERAASKGARIVEAYPLDVRDRKVTNAEAYTGFLPMFKRAGFKVAARPGGRRVIVRYAVAN